MISKLRGIAIFATVVDHGSFRAAAAHLGLSPSWISEAVSELEKEVGVTLLYRSTRNLSMSPEGRLLYDQAKIMMGAVEKGLDAIALTTEEPAGLLRVALPSFVTQTGLMDSIQEFAHSFRKVSLSLDFSDQYRDLIKDGFDVGIRVGWLKDSELLTRNIGYVERMLVVSTSYYERMPHPQHPKDLESWDWIRFIQRPEVTKMTSKDGAEINLRGTNSTTVYTADSVHQLILRGFGVSPLPANLALRGIEAGALVHLCPDWSLGAMGVHAVWPRRTNRANLTNVFVQFLLEDGQGDNVTAERIFS